MATQNSVDLVVTPNADGFLIGGGTTERDLTVTGGNITLTGSGAAVITLPATTSTLASLGLAQTFTAAQNMSAGLVGSATNDTATAGNIGEYISANVAIGSAAGLTTATPANVTSISLTAGDWDVEGNVGFIANTGTLATLLIATINNGTSATLPTAPNDGAYAQQQIALPAAATQIIPTGRFRVSLSGTTTIYLIAQATFTVSTLTAYGFIGARRAR